MQPGDDLWYLLDRDAVTADDLETLNDDQLTKMVALWRSKYEQQYFVTCARNWQPGRGPGGLNTFDCHDSTTLYPDRAMLLEAMSTLAEQSRGSAWIVITAEDIGNAMREALKARKSH